MTPLFNPKTNLRGRYIINSVIQRKKLRLGELSMLRLLLFTSGGTRTQPLAVGTSPSPDLYAGLPLFPVIITDISGTKPPLLLPYYGPWAHSVHLSRPQFSLG